MILHHYDISPYSEMIRLMLGYTSTPWLSAISPPMPPRPIVDPLVGGYRRIPVAQIGADVFCDTRIISTEIGRLSENQNLQFEKCATEEQELIRRIGTEYFMAVVQTAKPSSVLAMLIKRYWPWQIIGLVRDRAGVAKMSNLAPVSRKQQAFRVSEFKQTLENLLSDSEYLFSNQPTLSDFAAYHLIWFADLTRPENFSELRSALANWQNRMRSIGYGENKKISKQSAFKAASSNEPRAICNKENNVLSGRNVRVAPTDYARDAVEGILADSASDRYVVARETSQFGLVHVHLPKDGYQIETI